VEVVGALNFIVVLGSIVNASHPSVLTMLIARCLPQIRFGVDLFL
jgi:hypothetical protein